MNLPLAHAPFDVPLIFAQVRGAALARRFARLGLTPGDLVTRLSEESRATPVRVRTHKGEALLAPGMAAKVIVHHDDGHKTSVIEMQPSEEGHVEGLVCGTSLERGLAVLGIRENDRITLLRRVPAMDYQALLAGGRLLLPVGEAAKLWGTIEGRELQFAMAGKGQPFGITELLGGHNANAQLERRGLVPGQTLVLEAVRPSASAGADPRQTTVLSTPSGLRLPLRPDMEAAVIVRVP